ncbi:type I-E CRISPR-associated protein Cas6/Cse3/CasE [Microvirga aerophila]|uniref:CRISPR-associated protein Cse3 n=1 Tax=Microvirga aerophila TaxID=670291 RepID=A0A512C1C6_9HYPH|nr:type I-E CRISPR-associated protein Cas6/Cse3/CasE [Microvirga aerophila]GEO18009.1 CRISPR-associated protein Cse3 [Microvirga aerophila]
MMTLSLIRLDPDPAKAALWMAAEGLVRDGNDDGYGWHALLAASFGTLSPKPFRVVARPGRPPQLLAYSLQSLDELLAHARDFADPLVIAALRLERAEAKRMPVIGEGRRLGFEVRLRPTLRRDRDGDRTRTAEVDVYVAAREAAKEGPAPDRGEVYRAWLEAKLAAGGARLEVARAVEMRQVPLLRRDRDRRLTRVEGHSAIFVGTLTTQDAQAFNALLARGVGRHRAFGYGMLLLRPPEA